MISDDVVVVVDTGRPRTTHVGRLAVSREMQGVSVQLIDIYYIQHADAEHGSRVYMCGCFVLLVLCLFVLCCVTRAAWTTE